MTVRRNMFSSVSIIAITIVLIEISVGLLGNGFIVAINWTDWIKSRKLSSCNTILTSLGISRLLLQGTAIVFRSYSFFTLDTHKLDNVRITLRVIRMFANMTSAWLASCLSVFYCAKIATFTHPLFLRVKQRISGMVPQLLLGSLLLALFTSIPTVWANHDVYLCNSKGSLLGNTTSAKVNSNVIYLYFSFLYTVMAFFPFLIFLASSMLLMVSLWRHSRCMQDYAPDLQDSRTRAHVSAIKSLISFLILYTFSFVGETLQTMPTCLTDNTWTPAVTSVVVAAYPSGHSIVLILLNPRLKTALVQILRHMKCQQRQRLS